MATYCHDSFVPMSQAKLQEVAQWCQKFLNLRDWNIKVFLEVSVPEWLQKAFVDDGRVASVKVLLPYFTAWIWVSPERMRNCDHQPACCICHEMIHVLLFHYGFSNHNEQLVTTLENSLYQNWKNRRYLKGIN